MSEGGIGFRAPTRGAGAAARPPMSRPLDAPALHCPPRHQNPKSVDRFLPIRFSTAPIIANGGQEVMANNTRASFWEVTDEG
jgi:hypothetical protein